MGFFSRPRAPWSLSALEHPWAPLPSIFNHIERHVDKATGTLSEQGQALADDKVVFGDRPIRWAAGAMDGVLSHHMGSSDEKLRAKQLAKAIILLLDEASEATLAHVYRLTIRDTLLGIIDEVLKTVAMRARGGEAAARCRELGLYLARRAGHREAVKLGIALLGIVEGAGMEMSVLETLALHEEFALFSAVAMAPKLENPERALWRMAQKLEGWGRIHLTERLAQTKDVEIRRWLVREGFRNSIMTEYLAAICARAGDLAGELAREEVDSELLDAAAEILSALVEGKHGPAEGIDHYEEAPHAVTRYLAHVARSVPEHPRHFLAVHTLNGYLDEARDEAQRAHWAEFELEARVLCRQILQRSDFVDIALRAQSSTDETLAHSGDEMAHRLGLDSWQLYFDRLSTDPNRSSTWYRLMRETTSNRIDDVVLLAEQKLPLTSMATSPSQNIGVGGAYVPHSNLEWIVQELGRFPGKGWQLIRTALRSPAVRHRTMAVRALAAWPKSAWPDDAAEVLKRALDEEPDAGVHSNIEQALHGEQLDD